MISPTCTKFKIHFTLKPFYQMRDILVKRHLDVPAAMVLDALELLMENEVSYAISAIDKEEETLTIEVQYLKEERAVIHELEDLIADYEEEQEYEEEEDD